MTLNVGKRAGSLRSALSSAGVLVLSSSSNCNAAIIASSRLDALRFFLTSRSRYSRPDGYLSLAQVKYSRFTSTGSEPGIDLDKSIGGGGTVGGFDDCSLNPGASFSGAIPVR